MLKQITAQQLLQLLHQAESATSSYAFNITYTPTTTGTKNGTFTDNDNACSSPQTATLKGTGVSPSANLSATTLKFGNQRVNSTSAAQTVTLTNSGTSPLTIS